ncbi:MAG: histidine phosphatase family protein [Telluria sp.]|nr:histidine phosphatase family protein [Telluria sp.]
MPIHDTPPPHTGPRPNFTMQRRHVLAAALLWQSALTHAAGRDAEAALRSGGVVLAMRHALAPGTYDPPEFKLGECGTQRNLNDEGRGQARGIGAWFEARSLKPARVRSSPWCRCVDTATLAFGAAEPWAALGSPRAAGDARNAEHVKMLRQALVAASAPGRRFEVWVTHNFVLAELAGENTSSGEGLVLRANRAGAPEVLARLNIG